MSEVTKEPIVLSGKGIDGNDKSDWQYVEVPEADMFDKPHQGAEINGLRFSRGNTYFMPPLYASELKRILTTMDRADRRIMQSTPDVRSINQAPGTSQSTFIRS